VVPFPHLEGSALEWHVCARGESLPSQTEFVWQGAVLTDNHTEMSRKKGQVMDSFIKKSNLAAMNDMALMHTQIIESLSSVSQRFIEMQGSLAIQAFNAGTTVANASTMS
jgi:hypothetical protein